MLDKSIQSIIDEMLEVEDSIRELSRLIDWLTAHGLPCQDACRRLSEFQRTLRDNNAAVERLTGGLVQSAQD